MCTGFYIARISDIETMTGEIIKAGPSVSFSNGKPEDARIADVDHLMHSFIHPEDLSMIEKTFQDVVQYDIGVKRLFRLIARNGEHQRWVEGRFSPMSNNCGYTDVHCWLEEVNIQ